MATKLMARIAARVRDVLRRAPRTTAKTLDRARENYNISEIPEVAVDEINRIQIRSRLNSVVETGVPGFIAKGG